MRAAITLALVGMLAGASTAQVGTWETEQDGEGLILHLGDDGRVSVSATIPLGTDTLTVEYSGTWETDGDTLTLTVDPSTLTFNGQTQEELVDELVALLVAAMEEITGEKLTGEEIAAAREEILADMEAGLIEDTPLFFEVAGDTLTLTDEEGTVTVLKRREPVSAVQPSTWGAVKRRHGK